MNTTYPVNSRVTELKSAANQTLTLILAGGRGSRLKQLTATHSKPAVPMAGKFKIIDFPLSNCINSGFRRIGILTQYRSHTLNQHIHQGWNFLRPEFGEFIETWPAHQTSNNNWYEGTGDAIYQNIALIQEIGSKYVLVLAGDHLYKQDYSLMLMEHIRSGAKISVSCLEVSRDEARSFGVIGVNHKNDIVDFVEKPTHPPTLPDKKDRCLASMGIYIFNTEVLIKYLEQDALNQSSEHDFGKDILPDCLAQGERIHAHHFTNSCVRNQHYPNQVYWKDVGTLSAYWEANLDLTSRFPKLDLYDSQWPIHTAFSNLPAAKLNFLSNECPTASMNTVISGGCTVTGSTLDRSMLFNDVSVETNTILSQSIVLPNCQIGKNCHLEKVVLDSGCVVPDNMVIGLNPTWDAKYFYRNEDGVVLVTQRMLDQVPQKQAEANDIVSPEETSPTPARANSVTSMPVQGLA